ncbi:heterocyst differentiation related protein [Scytonema sp. UIC 10036]|uniref:heterocyst differentiation related protein n=1 Tax=Scytonema sp. UIC 10036 TaxID=2304196 RepID=UPI0012DA287F|nr:heterocyst differentiation related protein [Scytonema sp. UIC 10036]MUG99906.1 heterocyst differentiation related protein [Scytonema sp. UIC 10036]
MSESMAFIGGVAVAGLAALLLLKGSATPIQSGFSVSPQMPTTVVAPPAVMPPPTAYSNQTYPNPAPLNPNTEELRVQMERMKMENAQLQKENVDLKQQNQQLQGQIQHTLAQWSAQQQNQAQAAQQAALQQSQNPWWSSGIVWAVGGMALTVGGGVVVAGINALFSQKPRPARTVQVIHPYNGPTPPLAPVRRSEFLPPRNDIRRVETHDYDDTY